MAKLEGFIEYLGAGIHTVTIKDDKATRVEFKSGAQGYEYTLVNEDGMEGTFRTVNSNFSENIKMLKKIASVEEGESFEVEVYEDGQYGMKVRLYEFEI